MIILDSSVWIALLNKCDNQHRKALNLLELVKGNEIGVTEYVILEVATVIAQKAGKKHSDAFIAYISDNKDISILYSNKIFFSNVLAMFVRQKTGKLSFVDVSLLLMSDEHKVVTFDRILQKKISKK